MSCCICFSRPRTRGVVCRTCCNLYCFDCSRSFNTCSSCSNYLQAKSSQLSQEVQNLQAMSRQATDEVQNLRKNIKPTVTVACVQTQTDAKVAVQVKESCKSMTKSDIGAINTRPADPPPAIPSSSNPLFTHGGAKTASIKFCESVFDDATCPVCLETLKPSVKLCINGHATCTECKQNLSKCPTCREEFSNLKTPCLLQKILEALPRCCQFKNCGQFFSQGDDHENYCEWRPTVCKLCEWSGPTCNVSGHVGIFHSDYTVYTGTHIAIVLKNFCLDINYTKILPFQVFGEFFWIEMNNNVAAEMLKVFFYLIFSKKDFVIHVQIELKSDEDNSVIKRPLKKDFSLGLHSSLIESCINKDKELEICFNFTKT